MSLLIIGAMLAAAPAANAETVIGRWKTETHNAIVEIARCGPSICGRLVTSDTIKANPSMKDARNSDASLRNRPIAGMQMLSGFSPAADGVWENGKVYNAEDGKTYSGKITPVGANQLKLRGCVFYPLCKTQTWTRVR